MTEGKPTIDDVADAVFAALDIALEDSLEEAAIEHQTVVFERDVDHRPHEQRLTVDGVDYLVRVERSSTDHLRDAAPLMLKTLKEVEASQGRNALGPFNPFDHAPWPAVRAAIRQAEGDSAITSVIDNEPHFDISDDGVMIVLPGWRRNDEVTLLRLIMVNIEVDLATVATWTDEQCQQAEVYALSASLQASDNDDMQVPPKPAFLPDEKAFGEQWSDRHPITGEALS